MATPRFNNASSFAQKPISIEGLYDMPKFDVVKEANPDTSSLAAYFGTDSIQNALWVKNVVREGIYVGGSKIDFNFFFDLFWTNENMVNTKRLVNHYFDAPDFNVFAAASRTGTGSVTFQLLKQNHLNGGGYSLPSEGYFLFDKDNMKQYYISAVDKSIPYAHKVTIESTVSATEVITINSNTQYLVLSANAVGGYSCPNVVNDETSMGYVQQVNFLRLRRDWDIAIDILRGKRDKAQFLYTYDRDGKKVVSYEFYEQQSTREDLRMAFNVLSFIGSPILNQSLISGIGAVVDQDHPGYYGLIPSIKYGGGTVANFASSAGWDWESDFEPIALWQDSMKWGKEYMALEGTSFEFNNDYRTNKMVARQNVGSTIWEAYKRMSNETTAEGVGSYVEKLGVFGYDYRGWKIEKKHWESLSDKRFAGSDQWSNSMIMIPLKGCTEQGKEVTPIEFYQYGENGWTGDFEEHVVDNRNVTRCESISGYCAQSLAMKVHSPKFYVLAQGIADA